MHTFPLTPDTVAPDVVRSEPHAGIRVGYKNGKHVSTKSATAESQLHERRRKAKRVVSRLIDLPVL